MTAFRFLLRTVAGLLAAGSVGQAQMGPPLPAGKTTTAGEILVIMQDNAGLEGGGDMAMDRYGLEVGFMHGLKGGHAIGGGVGFTQIDYRFRSPPGTNSITPWDEIGRWNLDLVYRHAIDRESSIFVMPSLNWAGESGSDTNDRLTWGAIGGYVKQFSPTLSLGLGAGVFTGLEDTQGFPVIFVRWEIDESWYLGNPFRPGPAGRAGLELVYTGLADWEIGLGGGYRSDRFALDQQGVAPGGYGENSGTVLFVRASRSFSPQSSLDLYLGTIAGGELQLDDRRGHHLSSTDYDPSLILSIAFVQRW